MSEFEYDDNGNVYVVHKNEYYMININKEDDIVFEKIYNKIYNDKNKHINNIKIDFINRLHIKSMEDAVNDIDKNNDLEFFSEDQVEEITKNYNEIKINPEYKTYNNIEYELDDECYDDNEDNHFEIFTNDLKNSNLLYDAPCFETIIYKQNIVKFRTQLTNNNPFYRISIHENKMYLNIIGTKIKEYKFDYNTLEIKKVNQQTIDLI